LINVEVTNVRVWPEEANPGEIITIRFNLINKGYDVKRVIGNITFFETNEQYKVLDEILSPTERRICEVKFPMKDLDELSGQLTLTDGYGNLIHAISFRIRRKGLLPPSKGGKLLPVALALAGVIMVSIPAYKLYKKRPTTFREVEKIYIGLIIAGAALLGIAILKLKR